MTNSDLLQGLDPAEIDRLMALGKPMTLAAGDVLFRLGDAAGSLFLITRGCVRLSLPMQVRSHEESVTVEEQSTGHTVGWSALTPPYRFTLTATAALETEVVVLDRETLNAYFAANPETGRKVSLNLAGVIGHRLQVFQAMWVREVQRMVEARCA